VCDNPYHLDKFYDVVALYMKRYINDFVVTHAAKKIDITGYWSSKMGKHELAEHTLEAIEGKILGTNYTFLKRRK
jgi:hypothetical protein